MLKQSAQVAGHAVSGCYDGHVRVAQLLLLLIACIFIFKLIEGILLLSLIVLGLIFWDIFMLECRGDDGLRLLQGQVSQVALLFIFNVLLESQLF